MPFREVPYAEDRVLAIDMLRAGYAKAFVPAAAVWHSHDYTTLEQLRRCFDEWRGLREVYGWREPASPVHLAGQLRGALGQARRELIRQGVPAGRRRATLAAVSGHHVVRLAGALLGSRADRLPAGARRLLSLEGRASFRASSTWTAPSGQIDPHVTQHRSNPSTGDARAGRSRACAARIYLTYHYLGWRTLLFRALTFPLRFTPLKRRLRLRSHWGDDAYRRALAWYREHGEPVDIVIPSFRDAERVRTLVASIVQRPCRAGWRG